MALYLCEVYKYKLCLGIRILFVPHWAGWLHNFIYGIHCPFLLASPTLHSVWHVTMWHHPTICAPTYRGGTRQTRQPEGLPRGLKYRWWVYTSSIAWETSRPHTEAWQHIWSASPWARVRHNYLITRLMRWAMRISAAPGPGPDTGTGAGAGADHLMLGWGWWWVTSDHPGITESYQSFDWSFINLVSSCGSGHQWWL